jgi:hypothetical protein
MDKITVVLNCYRRYKNLRAQIESIQYQQLDNLEKEIWLWVNDHEDNKDLKEKPYGVDVMVRSSKNFKYHGRFTLGLLSKAKYLAYFDDDTIPGPYWFKNCISTDTYLKETVTNNIPSILGSAGVLLHSRKYIDHTRYGWPHPTSGIAEVDLVGHAWFFERKILNYMWSKTPLSLDNGEDIQLSHFAKTTGGIRTFCPPHPIECKDLWGSLYAECLGTDDVAMSNGKVISHADFFKERDDVIEACLKDGWQTVKRIK